MAKNGKCKPTKKMKMTAKKRKNKKYDAEDITMLCIQFCEAKQILNAEMGLSTIESIRRDRPSAVKKLRMLVKNYGNTNDKKKLVRIKNKL